MQIIIFLEFHARTTTIMTIFIIPWYNNENQEISKIPNQNHENLENLIIPFKSIENHEIQRISYQNHKKYKN